MITKITFADWVEAAEKAGRTKAQIAKDLRVELASLYRYLSRDRVPTKAVMDRIIAKSQGRVDLAWFYAKPAVKRKAAA